MQSLAEQNFGYVVKVDELGALNHLPHDCSRPLQALWINRETDQALRPTTVASLLRTLDNEVASASVVKLHRSSGLRLVFSSEADRRLFASQLKAAKSKLAEMVADHSAATFDGMNAAQTAIASLMDAGVPTDAISMLWRANLFLDPQARWHEGHSEASVAGATLGGGIAGMAFALALLMIPGVGQIAAVGAIASAQIGAVTAFGGIAGATGGAIARMLTDLDVDGVSARFYEDQVRKGKIVVSVRLSMASVPEGLIRTLFRANGGKVFRRA